MGLSPTGGIIGSPQGFSPSPSVNAKLPLTSITSTALTPILQYTPIEPDAFSVRLLILVSASATATVYIAWTGEDGTSRQWNWMTSYPLPAGAYSMPPINLYANASEAIVVYIQVTETDVVRVSGSIDRIV